MYINSARFRLMPRGGGFKSGRPGMKPSQYTADAAEVARMVPDRRTPMIETTAAKDDGRLPMTDHNTRIFVVGESREQARAVAEAIVKDAFHNVSFFNGTVADLARLASSRAGR
jgi:hypothetical protein